MHSTPLPKSLSVYSNYRVPSDMQHSWCLEFDNRLRFVGMNCPWEDGATAHACWGVVLDPVTPSVAVLRAPDLTRACNKLPEVAGAQAMRLLNMFDGDVGMTAYIEDESDNALFRHAQWVKNLPMDTGLAIATNQMTIHYINFLGCMQDYIDARLKLAPGSVDRPVEILDIAILFQLSGERLWRDWVLDDVYVTQHGKQRQIWLLLHQWHGSVYYLDRYFEMQPRSYSGFNPVPALPALPAVPGEVRHWFHWNRGHYSFVPRSGTGQRVVPAQFQN